jgi:hypothetical protein
MMVGFSLALTEDLEDGDGWSSMRGSGGDGGSFKGSSIRRRESIHVGGLCGNIDREMYHTPDVRLHCESEATKKDRHQRRPSD